MSKSVIEEELEGIIHNLKLDLDNGDEGSKEYAQAVTNLSKLHQVWVGENDIEFKKQDFEFKKQRNELEDNMKKRQLKFEKEKFKQECDLKEKELEIRLQEVKLRQIQAENEKIILLENQKRAERDAKTQRKKDLLIFGVKMFGVALIGIITVAMHKDELNFERKENGIVPRRCSNYDTIMNKLSDVVMK